MDPALIRLHMMRLRGGLRLRLSQLFSWRGLLFVLGFGGIIWLYVATNASAPDTEILADVTVDRQAISEQVRTFMPLGMFAMSVLTVLLMTGPTFHFSPSEINFLFTGPFRRRDLILYKFSAYVAGVMLSSLIIMPFVQSQTGSALSVFIASLLTLVFVQLNSAVIAMAGQALEGSRIARLRWPAIGVLFAAAVGAVLYTWMTPECSLIGLLSEFRHSWVGTIILIPYIVFAELFLATSLFPGLAIWAAFAILINAALLYAAILLDARTTDRALKENAKNSQRWERIKQGGSYWATERTEMRSTRRVPVLGGLGPIAWRQSMNALRNSFKVILIFIGLAAGVGPITSGGSTSVSDPKAIMIIYIFFAFILPRTLVFDFRGELSRMEIYKTLPIPPWRICAGQLLVQVLVTYAVALAMIGSILIFEESVTATVALILAAFGLPLIVLIFALENTIFLLFPKKLVPMGRADFEFMGRSIVEFIAKTTVILAAMAASSTVGIVALLKYKATLLLSGLASWFTLVLFGLIVIVAMQYAFRRFQVAETID